MWEPAESRSLARCGVLGALLLVCSVACGGASRGGSEGGGGGSSGDGSGHGASAGTLPGGGGAGGADIVPGQAGAVSAALPNATAEEQAVLDPLFIDSDEIDGAEVAQLIELGASIGVARGFAMCRCSGVFSDLSNLIACAVDEAGGLAFTRSPPQATQPQLNRDLDRCLQEEAAQRPWFADALRCELRWHQANGRAWLELCSLPGFDGNSASYPMTPFDCPGVDEAMREAFSLVIVQCRDVAYCDDGTRVSPGRCSGTRECLDWSDELSCFDVVGHDMVRCGDEIAPPWGFCSLTSCGDETDPPLCDETRARPLQCPEGTELSYDSICDRRDDCEDGADERYCLR